MSSDHLEARVVDLRVDANIATLWLARPEARNALGQLFWRQLPEICADIESRDDVRVVIVAAQGRDFSVGLDLKEMGPSLTDTLSERSPALAHQRTFANVRRLQNAVSSLTQLSVPVIAAVHGLCLGGGIDLISACDIRVASSNAIFSVRETKMAIVADLGTLQRLPRIIGPGHTAELAFTGDDIDANRALAIGLINHIAGDDDTAVYQYAREIAERIAKNSPLAVRGTKTVLAANDGRSVSEGLEFVANWNTLYLASNDLREALNAFLEKREPHFRGD